MNLWSDEDVSVWKALVKYGFISAEEPRSLLSVVNAARLYERQRIYRSAVSMPDIPPGVLSWLKEGAPDFDSR